MQDPFAQYAVTTAPADDPFAAYAAKLEAPRQEAAPPQGDTREWRNGRPVGPGNALPQMVKLVRENPVETGAMLGGAVAGPFTGGLSVPATMALIGGGTAVGAGAGNVAKQATDDQPFSGRDLARDMAVQGGIGAATAGLPGLARLPFKLARGGAATAATVADMAGMVGVPGANQVARVLRIIGRVKPSGLNPNAGGRLVPGQMEKIEDVIAGVLDDVRTPTPTGVELPPPARLPAGYTPRSSAIAPQPAGPSPNAGGRLVPGRQPPRVEDELAEALEDVRQAPRPGSVELPPPPTQPAVSYPRVAHAHGKAPGGAPKPTGSGRVPKVDAPPATSPPAAPAELPNSWKQFAGAAPRETAPLGLSADAPLWSRAGMTENLARDMRGALGADDAGALMGMEADDVRALSGAARRRPLVADLADMDLSYMRQLANPRGGTPAGVLVGMGAIPGAELLRQALLAALSEDDPKRP